MDKKTTLAVIVGNRGFFPARLADEGRKEVLSLLRSAGIKTVCLSPADTPHGAVENWSEAQKCADLLRSHAAEIDGILITLPNFGDEKAVANAIRLSGLNVPVLVQAYPDDPEKMDRPNRRDSFCGKMSVCNNLKQYGIPFSLTSLHTEAPASPIFSRDLDRFVRLCRVVRGMRKVRVGAIGARTGPFNTVRFSEKILEANGIAVEVVDLSEVLGWVSRMSDKDAAVRARIRKIRSYMAGDVMPEASLLKMAKFHIAIERWVRDNEINSVAIQCWTSIEQNFGLVPCAMMSMMSESLLPAACEVDVMGALGMYALQLASGNPSALVDWNNNYGDDPDLAVLFHCSNLPSSCFREVTMGIQTIIAESVGNENAYACVAGTMKAGPLTFARLSTDDVSGAISGYVAEGEIVADMPKTFGGVGIARLSNLQRLLHYICENGYEHHVAVNYDSVASVLHESFSNYLGWDIYHHV
jgi:L-fucose isomerase-like protein